MLAPVPAEPWVTYPADMNWRYTMGAAIAYSAARLSAPLGRTWSMKAARALETKASRR